MARHTVRPKSDLRPKLLKSSLEARKLIRAAIKQSKGNKRAAARLLKLPNDSQLHKMLKGTIKDTPAMLLALKQAEKRYYNLKREARPHQLAAVNATTLETARDLLLSADKLLKGLIHEPANNHDQPAQPGQQPAVQDSQHHPEQGTED